jgi:hypothetical protein
MSEVNEETLPRPDIRNDYRTFWQRLAYQETQKHTATLLDRKGIASDAKEFRLETEVPYQLMHLLRLKSKRDSYYGIVADILTATKDCETKFVINLVPGSNKDGIKQLASLNFGLFSEIRGKVMGSYELVLQQGKPPEVDFKMKRSLGYKKIPKWIFRMVGVGDRDFEIVKDTLDLIVAKDPSITLYKKEYVEHQRQIRGDRWVDEYSQEEREIEAEARTKVLRDWPGALLSDLD